jgi:hypothetical protein
MAKAAINSNGENANSHNRVNIIAIAINKISACLIISDVANAIPATRQT